MFVYFGTNFYSLSKMCLCGRLEFIAHLINYWSMDSIMQIHILEIFFVHMTEN